MARQTPDLRTLLDIPQWEKVQDQLALLTGTAIITIDFKGTPITKHSSRTEFCSIIRENPIARKRCFRCDALAGLISDEELNENYIIAAAFDPRVGPAVAKAVAEAARASGVARI